MLSSNFTRTFLLKTLFSLLCAMGIHSTTIAEEIRIPIGQQAGDATVEMPAKGMTKEQVKATFGDPFAASEPKGNPPISRWSYDDFVVYFEYDHVIHSVRVFKPKATPSPLE